MRRVINWKTCNHTHTTGDGGDTMDWQGIMHKTEEKPGVTARAVTEFLQLFHLLCYFGMKTTEDKNVSSRRSSAMTDASSTNSNFSAKRRLQLDKDSLNEVYMDPVDSKLLSFFFCNNT